MNMELMNMDGEFAKILSQLLWRYRAIEVCDRNPFQLTSGSYTPIYINCRPLISFPAARDIITSFAHFLHDERKMNADCIAGGETSGIPFGAWLAQRLAKPFVYVRKKKKEHGIGTRVEGIPEGRVLLFEDLITDGGSKLAFIEGIRETGCTISDCLVVVDREEGGAASLAKIGITLHSLVGISTCLKMGREMGLLSAEALTQVEGYLADAEGWNRRRGLLLKD